MKFDLTNFLELDTKALMAINGGGTCGGGSCSSGGSSYRGGGSCSSSSSYGGSCGGGSYGGSCSGSYGGSCGGGSCSSGGSCRSEKSNLDMYAIYKNGNGSEKTLDELGLLDKVKDAVKNNENLTANKDASIEQRFINQIKEGNTEFERSYDFTSVKFVLGGVTISGEFDGTVTDNPDGTKHVEGSISYSFYDKFTDPYDVWNKIPGEWNPDGTPYEITGTWSEQINGNY